MKYVKTNPSKTTQKNVLKNGSLSQNLEITKNNKKV